MLNIVELLRSRINTVPENNLTDASTICRTCLSIIKQNLCPDEISVREKLYKYCPEVDLRINLKTVLCGNCAGTICFMSEFKQCHLFNRYIEDNSVNLKMDKTKTNPQTFKCVDCNYHAPRYDILEEHKLFHCTAHQKTDYSMGKSDLQLYVSKYIQEEEINNLQPNYGTMSIHTNLKKIKCSMCNYVSPQQTILKRHMLIHTGEKPFKCNKCDYSSRDNSTLKRHMHIHSSIKRFKCSKCDYSASRKSTLNRHMLGHIEERSPKFNQCNFSATQAEKPFKCSYCDYSVSQKVSLDKHVLLHTGEKLFKCRKCNFSAKDKITLKQHMLVHRKSFKCYHCSYESAKKSALIQHLDMHADIKQFKCNHCDYSCSHRTLLYKHMHLHLGENPLRRHMLSHTEEKLLHCSQCDYTTSHKMYLQQHIFNHKTKKQHVNMRT